MLHINILCALRLVVQIEHQLQSGNLTSEQHVTLVKQLEQLYELQKLKDEEGNNDGIQPTQRPPSSTATDTKTHQTKDEQQSVEQSSKGQQETNRPDGTKTFSRKDFISLSDSKSDSVFFVDTSGAVDNLDNHFGPTHRGGRPPHSFRGRPQHYKTFEREERYYAGPPRGGGHFRGDSRPPYRSRRGRPFYPRRSRGGRDHPYNGPEGPPPHMGPGRGSGRILQGQPLPPPPHWHEPPRQGLIL